MYIITFDGLAMSGTNVLVKKSSVIWSKRLGLYEYIDLWLIWDSTNLTWLKGRSKFMTAFRDIMTAFRQIFTAMNTRAIRNKFEASASWKTDQIYLL